MSVNPKHKMLISSIWYATHETISKRQENMKEKKKRKSNSMHIVHIEYSAMVDG